MKNKIPKKPRGDWNGIRPFTRIIQSKKRYDRRRAKDIMRKKGFE